MLPLKAQVKTMESLVGTAEFEEYGGHAELDRLQAALTAENTAKEATVKIARYEADLAVSVAAVTALLEKKAPVVAKFHELEGSFLTEKTRVDAEIALLKEALGRSEVAILAARDEFAKAFPTFNIDFGAIGSGFAATTKVFKTAWPEGKPGLTKKANTPRPRAASDGSRMVDRYIQILRENPAGLGSSKLVEEDKRRMGKSETKSDVNVPALLAGAIAAKIVARDGKTWKYTGQVIPVPEVKAAPVTPPEVFKVATTKVKKAKKAA